MKNYAAGMPVGNNQMPVGALTPAPYEAIAVNGSTNQVTSSVLTLTENTTAIEIAATGAGGAIMRWVPVTETAGVSPNGSIVGISSVGGGTPNFDHAIPANTVRRFVVPVENSVNTTYGATITSVQGANRENGLYRRVAVISAGGVSSVLLTEYGSSNSY